MIGRAAATGLALAKNLNRQRRHSALGMLTPIEYEGYTQPSPL
jgi:hypothetical protein